MIDKALVEVVAQKMYLRYIPENSRIQMRGDWDLLPEGGREVWRVVAREVLKHLGYQEAQRG